MQDRPSPSLRQHKIHFYRQIAFTFIGAAIVVLIGLLYFSLSQAQVTVSPALEQVQADFHILVKADEERTNEGIKAQLHSQEISVERTGMGELQEEGDPKQATGTITILNTSNAAQPLVATTRFLSEEGILFRLEEGTTVPANGEVEAAVFADEEGKQGEVGPTRFTVPGLNQARQQEVYAKSDSSMTGGTASIYLITQESVDKTIAEAENSLMTQAKALLSEDGVDIDSLLDGAHVEVLSQSVSPAVGETSQDFKVTMEALIVFVEADDRDLLEVAQKELFGQTNIGYELSSSNEGSFTYDISSYDEDADQAQVHVVLSGERRISANHPSLDPSNFVGRKPLEIKGELEGDAGIDQVTIELRPFWLRKVPRLVDHIYVHFDS
jgi:hypothetical protein